ncbi:MAG: hypothetical protein N0E55_16910, partial [Candidatus Thiodiazotropha taylori]|nr:hypothetical protein [Candidatus Thiodiazotropha taylori]MCW4254369.1 hypothetical protein [Candidatus Thiodiazotropha taylori]
RVIYKRLQNLYFSYTFKILNYLLMDDLGAPVFRLTDLPPRRDRLVNPQQVVSGAAVSMILAV